MWAAIRDRITTALVPAITRHVAQMVGTALMATGLFATSQETSIRGYVAAGVGAIISLVAAALAAKDTTPTAIVTKAANLPEVKKIVVNDPALAGPATPSEVVYGRDMSIQ